MKVLIYSFILILIVSCGQGNERKLNEPQVKNHIETTKVRLVKSMIPKDYDELTESPSNGRKMKRLIFDFDLDNKSDTALIAVYQNDFTKCLLIVSLSSNGKTHQLKLRNNPPYHSFPVQLTAKNDVLQVGYFKDGTSNEGRFLKWKYNKKAKDFRLIGYDSGYCIGTSDYCSKSYQLISGDYTVKLQKSLPTEHVETFSGIFKLDPIYMKDFNLTVLNRLDQVGNEFEFN